LVVESTISTVIKSVSDFQSIRNSELRTVRSRPADL